MLRKTAIAVAGALAATGLMLAAADDAAAKKRPGACAQLTGKGTGIGQDLAKSFATDALVDGQAQRGMKGQGKITYKCSNASGFSSCSASQRSCAVPAKKS